jgi:uncharacterized protein YqgV (UPF0045/DUF77 family)
MIVALEISLYPLGQDVEKPIDTFLQRVAENKKLTLEPGKMSSIITGELSDIMETLALVMKTIFEENAAVFHLKISNCCPV